MSNLPELLPIVILIHDSWHIPTHYSTLIDTLSSLGYAVACPQLLTSHTESNCTSTFNDDCSLIYQLVFDLCSDGNDIVALCHGYGGFIASEALGELSKDERNQAGKIGGVIGMVSLAGMLPEQGQSLKDVYGGEWPECIRQHVSCCQSSSKHYPADEALEGWHNSSSPARHLPFQRPRPYGARTLGSTPRAFYRPHRRHRAQFPSGLDKHPHHLHCVRR